MKKIIEIDRCNPMCPYNAMHSLSNVYCRHYMVSKKNYKPKRIPYSRLSDKHQFPEWCPLQEAPQVIDTEKMEKWKKVAAKKWEE